MSEGLSKQRGGDTATATEVNKHKVHYWESGNRVTVGLVVSSSKTGSSWSLTVSTNFPT